MNEKTEAVNRLNRLGLNGPPSLTIAYNSLSQVEELLSKNPDVEFWYLRSIRSEESFISRRVVASTELATFLKDLFASNPETCIVVQERVDVAYSGVFAKTDDMIFIEYVEGGLQSLLRDGVTPSRLAFSTNRELLARQLNRQEFCYKWEADKLIREAEVIPRQIDNNSLNALLETAGRIEESVVLEWLEDKRGRIYFIDIKAIPSSFLISKKHITIGMEQGIIISLDLPIMGHLINIEDNGHEGVFLLKAPLYNSLDRVLKYASAVVMKAGGILSHLSVYATKKNVTCIISSDCYDQLIDEDVVDTSASELLNTIS